MVSLLVVLALVGTPSVVAACALLCLPDAGHHDGASVQGPAAEAAAAHADCHRSQAAATVTTGYSATRPAAPASRIDASIEHPCCPDASGLPAVASAHARGSADPLTGAPASSLAPRDGEWLLTSRALIRHPDALPRPSFARAPLVLRI